MSLNSLRAAVSWRCRSWLLDLRAAVQPLQAGRTLSDSAAVKGTQFDESLLKFLVCPLSKKPLRYEETTNELINDQLGIAYPIIDGIPNMVPQDARMIKTPDGSAEPQH